MSTLGVAAQPRPSTSGVDFAPVWRSQNPKAEHSQRLGLGEARGRNICRQPLGATCPEVWQAVCMEDPDGWMCLWVPAPSPLQSISRDVTRRDVLSLLAPCVPISLSVLWLSDGSNMWPSEQSPGNGVFGKGPQTSLNQRSAGRAQNLCSAEWTSLIVRPPVPEYLLRRAFATPFVIAFLKSV